MNIGPAAYPPIRPPILLTRDRARQPETSHRVRSSGACDRGDVHHRPYRSRAKRISTKRGQIVSKWASLSEPARCPPDELLVGGRVVTDDASRRVGGRPSRSATHTFHLKAIGAHGYSAQLNVPMLTARNQRRESHTTRSTLRSSVAPLRHGVRQGCSRPRHDEAGARTAPARRPA